MTSPACFESQSQYDAWREAANVCRPRHGYCEDCTPEYQARMIETSRCKYPNTVFVGTGMGMVGQMVRGDRS